MSAIKPTSSTSELFSDFLFKGINSNNLEVVKSLLKHQHNHLNFADPDLTPAYISLTKSSNVKMLRLLSTHGASMPSSVIKKAISNSTPEFVSEIYKHNNDACENLDLLSYTYEMGSIDCLNTLIREGMTFHSDGLALIDTLKTTIHRYEQTLLDGEFVRKANYLLQIDTFSDQCIAALSDRELHTLSRQLILANDTSVICRAADYPTLIAHITSPELVAVAYTSDCFNTIEALFELNLNISPDRRVCTAKDDTLKKVMTCATFKHSVFTTICEAFYAEISSMSEFSYFSIVKTLANESCLESLAYFIEKTEEKLKEIVNDESSIYSSEFIKLCISTTDKPSIAAALLDVLPDSISWLEGCIAYSFPYSRNHDLLIKLPEFLKLASQNYSFSKSFYESIMLNINESELHISADDFLCNPTDTFDALNALIKQASAVLDESVHTLIKENSRHFEDMSPAQIISSCRRNATSDRQVDKLVTGFCLLMSVPEDEKDEYLNKMIKKDNFRCDIVFKTMMQLWSFELSDILNRRLSNKSKKHILSSIA